MPDPIQTWRAVFREGFAPILPTDGHEHDAEPTPAQLPAFTGNAALATQYASWMAATASLAELGEAWKKVNADRIADLLGETVADALVTIRVPRPAVPFDGALVSYYGEKTTARPDLETAARDWIESGMWSALEAYAMHANDYSRGVLRTTYNPTTRTWGEWK